MILFGPVLVSGDADNFVQPTQWGHGPFEDVASGLLVASSRVFGEGFQYYATGLQPPAGTWTQASYADQADKNYVVYDAQGHYVAADGAVYSLANSNTGPTNQIAKFDIATQTYSLLGAFATRVLLSHVAPIAVRKLSNGDVLVVGTAAGVVKYYRFTGGVMGTVKTIAGAGVNVAAILDDGVNPVAHLFTVDTGVSPNVMYYTKVFADDTTSTPAVALDPISYVFPGMLTNRPYGTPGQYFDGRLWVAMGRQTDGTAGVLYTSAIDATLNPPTFALATGVTPPEDPPDGFVDTYPPSVFVAGTGADAKLYLGVPCVTYDGDGAPIGDVIYTAEWTGAAFATQYLAVDWIANPPSPPAGPPPAGSQQSHFQSMEGFADGSAGVLTDFFDANGDCTSYYTLFGFTTPPPPVAPAATQGIGGAPLIYCKAINHWDDCLDAEMARMRKIHFPDACAVPLQWRNRLPWEDYSAYPEQAVPFRVMGGIVTPATAAGDQTIVSLRVPTGYDGLLTGLYWLYSGTGFEQGSGDLLFRVRVNLRYLKDLSNVPYLLGNPATPIPLTEGAILQSNQTVRAIVNVPDLSGMIQIGASTISAALLGFYWPR